MPGVGESLGPHGKRGAFARISAEILELAEGAAKDLRLLPVGGTGTRGVGEYKQPSLFDWTVTGQILSRDSHRRVPLHDAREPNGTRVLCAGEGGPMVYPRGFGPPLQPLDVFHATLIGRSVYAAGGGVAL